MLDFEDWYFENEDELNIKFAESGADREMDFNLENEIQKLYDDYLESYKDSK